MKEYLEHMRFPVRGSNDFWHVVKTDRAKVYDVYYAEVEMYPDVVSIYHYLMDLNQFSEEELGRYVLWPNVALGSNSVFEPISERITAS